MDIRKFNELLLKGICPDELNFSKEPQPIDISKIQYNAFYRSYEFVENKFPSGYETIPGFDKVINMIAENLESTTPLEEILEKSSINK